MSQSSSAILRKLPLGFPWPTIDPFLFCVYHKDNYPKGNGQCAPAVSLAGRDMGQDFSGKDGFSMYHGRTVPGFPQHPHRGFETVTVVRQGRIDHSDSLGAKARFGDGDAQWLTAGKGIVHCEMFPLLSADSDNPLELFQLWLNLPARNKMAAPYFDMLWSEKIPKATLTDAAGKTTQITVVAGAFATTPGDTERVLQPQAPPPDSWAAAASSDVAIWTLKMAAGARCTLPPSRVAGARRMLYFFGGSEVSVGGESIAQACALELRTDAPLELVNGAEEAEFLLLQGVPIGEPVAAHGPFVMNTRNEILQAMQDYQHTQFGGWPWASDGPVHGQNPARFAERPGGKREEP